MFLKLGIGYNWKTSTVQTSALIWYYKMLPAKYVGIKIY